MPLITCSCNGVPTPPARRARRGFVLVAALLAIVLIAALAAGVLFATTEATRAGSAGILRERALIASESALVAAINTSRMDLPAQTGVRGTSSQRIDADGWQVIVYITRLDSVTYWVLADTNGLTTGTGARKRVAVFVKAVGQDDHSMTVAPISELGWAEVF